MNGLINQVVGKEAFEQLERLVDRLVKAKGVLEDFISTGSKAEADMKNSSGYSSTAKNAEALGEAVAGTTEALKDFKVNAAIVDGVMKSYNGTVQENIKLSITHKSRLTELKAEKKELDKQFADKSTKEYKDKLTEIVKQEQQVKLAAADLNQTIKAQIKETNAASGSMDAMSQRLGQLKDVYRQLSEADRNSTAGKHLLAEISQTDIKLKALDRTLGNHFREVGNYRGGIMEAARSTGIFSGQISKLTQIQETLRAIQASYTASVNSGTTATGGFSRSLGVLKLAIAATGIGVLVLALGALVSFFTQTERGADQLSFAMAYLKGIVLPLKDAVIGLGENISKAFTNPKRAMLDLVEFMKNQLVNRFKAFGVIIEGIKNMDFKQITNGAIQLGTGVEKAVDKMAAFGKKVDEVARKNLDLEKRRDALSDKEIDNLTVLAKLNDQIEEKRLLASEALDKSVKKRYLTEAKALVDKKGAIELSMATERAAIAQAQLQQGEATEDARREAQQLAADKITLEATVSKEKRAIQRQLTSLEKGDIAAIRQEEEQAEKDRQKAMEAEARLLKAQVDLSRKLSDARADEFKRQADDEKLTYDEREAALDQYYREKQSQIIAGAEFEKLVGEKTADEIKVIELTKLHDLQTLLAQHGRDKLALLKKQTDDETKYQIEGLEKIVKNVELQQQSELNVLLQKLKDKKITLEVYEREAQAIRDKYAKISLDSTIEYGQDLIDRDIAIGDERKKVQDAIDKAREAGSKATTEKIIDNEKRLADAQRNLARELYGTFVALNDALSQKRLNAIDSELRANEKALQFEIDKIKSTTLSEQEKQDQITALEKDAQIKREALEERKRKERVKQAKLNKALNIAELIAETTIAVVRALGKKPYTYDNIALAAATGALGAAQIARAASTTIPEYAVGVEHSPETFAIVGEKGPEGRINPDGSFEMTPGVPTLTYLEKGTKIIPNHEIAQLAMSSSYVTPTGAIVEGNKNAKFFAQIERATERSAAKIVSAIKEQKPINLKYVGKDWDDYIADIYH